MRTAGTFGWWLAIAALPALAQPTIQFTAIRALASNQVELVWSSDTNRLFAIERTTDAGDWDNALCVAIPEPSAQFASNHWAGAMDTDPGFFRLLASPPLDPSVVSHTNLGTPTNDTQLVIGTTNRDFVMQFGNQGNDMQYASTADGNDWIFQKGGAGSDTQTGRGGTGNDWVWQQGGDDLDTQSVDGADGDDCIFQQGGAGDDNINLEGGDGDDVIYQEGGAGNDTVRVDGGHDDDFISTSGGAGDDSIIYDVSDGFDSVHIDGSNGSDTLSVYYAAPMELAIRLPDGTDLYTIGAPKTLITVTDLELIYAVGSIGTNAVTNWVGSAP